MISIEHLTRDYGNGKGIFDVSFSVDQGEVFGFLGPNGAGKTTTIRHLMGFIKPRSGKCEIDGKDCWKQSDEIQKALGYIPGEISFWDDLTGKEYLQFLMDYRKIRKDNRTEELLERFELDPNARIKKMSKGMKQKIGIVAAFMHDPDILILDEPTSGLDPLMQNRFIELIREEKEKGKTILLSSHIFEEVERTCDRIGMIREGRLVTVDSVETLRNRHVHRYTVRLKTKEEAEAFAREFDGTVVDGDDLAVTVAAKQGLENIFMNYYGGGAQND